MLLNCTKSVIFWIAAMFLGAGQCCASNIITAQQTAVSMRMIGHEMLLQAGDTVSRVLPVQKDGESYVIGFEAEFAIDPELMATTIDSIIAATTHSKGYIVELKSCETADVVHSYRIGGLEDPDVVPCKTRPLPVGCYVLWITLLDTPNLQHNKEALAESTESENSRAALLWLPLILLLGVALYLVKNKRKNTHDTLTAIGEYSFDPKAMTLCRKSECVELTGKESELLSLLYASVNVTLGRDLILEKVWGDQGDYVGRTLDVFVSRLRKKLEADSRIQIKNIRGVGYKLVISAA